MNYIYVYTNKINGHQYIGQTNNLERRKREHLSCSYNENSNSYNHLFHKKIREYGINNFDFDILEEIEGSIEEVNEAEKKWIKKLHTHCNDNMGGYNMDFGGQNYISYVYKDIINEIKKDIKEGKN